MQKIDTIKALFNGVETSFALAVSGVAIVPSNAADLLVIYNGVAQEPVIDYTVNLSNIVFAIAPAAGRDCFVFYAPSVSAGDTSLYRVAGESVGGFRVVYENSNGEVFYASSDDIAHSGDVLGVTTGAASLGDVVAVIRQGQVVDAALNLTPGPLFMGVNGVVTSIPASTGVSLQIGKASTASIAVIDVQPAIIRS